MPVDGEVDYRKFTRAQLEEALTRIDGSAYPLNLAHLTAELARRPPDPPPPVPVLDEDEWLSAGGRWFWAFAFPSIFLAVGLFTVYSLLWNQDLITWNLPSGPSRTGSDVAAQWVAAFMFIACALWVSFHHGRLKRIRVQQGELVLHGLRRTTRIPLADVSEAVWITRPHRENTPVVALRLSRSCVFGNEIRFAPRTEDVVERINNTIAGQSGRRTQSARELTEVFEFSDEERLR